MKTYLFILLILPSVVRAHHGQDFLVSLDSGVPHVGHVSAFTSFEWSRNDGTDELSLEPGFMAGILPGIALGTSVRLADDGPEGWDYTAIDPQVQWTLPSGGLPVSFAISVGYVFADGSATDGHSAARHHHEEEEEEEEHDDEHHPGVDNHGHSSGIHRHSEDHFHLRLIADASITESTRVVVNLIGVAPGSGEYDFGYSLGIRHRIARDWAVGLENIGDFNVHGENEVIAGLYWTPVRDCTIRLGLGTGIGSASTDFSVRSGITWRF